MCSRNMELTAVGKLRQHGIVGRCLYHVRWYGHLPLMHRPLLLLHKKLIGLKALGQMVRMLVLGCEWPEPPFVSVEACSCRGATVTLPESTSKGYSIFDAVLTVRLSTVEIVHLTSIRWLHRIACLGCENIIKHFRIRREGNASNLHRPLVQHYASCARRKEWIHHPIMFANRTSRQNRSLNAAKGCCAVSKRVSRKREGIRQACKLHNMIARRNHG